MRKYLEQVEATLAQYDWVWSQVQEVCKKDIVHVVESARNLAAKIKIYVNEFLQVLDITPQIAQGL